MLQWRKNLSIFKVEKNCFTKSKEYRIIFVDDGSDGTLSDFKRTKWCMWPSQLCIFFTQFGKEAALYAGLKQAKYSNGRGSSESTRVISSNEIYTLDEDEDIDW